jgi:hypothetical protein
MGTKLGARNPHDGDSIAVVQRTKISAQNALSRTAYFEIISAADCPVE